MHPITKIRFKEWLDKVDELVVEFKKPDDVWDREYVERKMLSETYPRFTEIFLQKNKKLFQEMHLTEEKIQLIVDEYFVRLVLNSPELQFENITNMIFGRPWDLPTIQS